MARNKTNLSELSSRKSKIKHLIFSDNTSKELVSPLTANGEEQSSIFVASSISSAESAGRLDNGKRAYEISNASTKEFEMSILKSRTSVCFKLKRALMNLLALWQYLFKSRGQPRKSESTYRLMFALSVSLTVDILLTALMSVHIFYPSKNLSTVGVPFLFMTPGATIISPLLGSLACLFGSPELLKRQAAFNRCAALVNYPLTLAYLIWTAADPFYIAIVILLLVNKIAMSHAGSSVEMHLRNPRFAKNCERIEDRFRSLLQAQSEARKGYRDETLAKDRASCFIGSGLPSMQETYGAQDKGRLDSDDESDDEDDTSFGIIPKSKVPCTAPLSQF